ncbi:hypothetical protein B0H66DRAFT_334327 [Apodospora peruviana]|uniref:Uncharacterized protein n=1 Tax=Apodospora peruviana TaxID=516989 RepID=A0AAE0HY97_9PEZI|nr:hypothetical protein B0H66DRAFT_334327 [Apodospora peruviana]
MIHVRKTGTSDRRGLDARIGGNKTLAYPRGNLISLELPEKQWPNTLPNNKKGGHVLSETRSAHKTPVAPIHGCRDSAFQRLYKAPLCLVLSTHEISKLIHLLILILVHLEDFYSLLLDFPFELPIPHHISHFYGVRSTSRLAGFWHTQGQARPRAGGGGNLVEKSTRTVGIIPAGTARKADGSYIWMSICHDRRFRLTSVVSRRF